MDFKNRGLFQRPKFDQQTRTVKAKPIAEKYAKKLGAMGGGLGKDFVTASAESQHDFYGKNKVLDEGPSTSAASSTPKALTPDERNKISAKIIKAEMMGNKALVEKLKKKLEGGNTDEPGKAEEPSRKGGDEEILLTRTDKRTGLTVPVQSMSSSLTIKCLKDDEKNSNSKNLRELVEEERNTTAEDQIEMFGELASKMSEREKITDDWSIDDVFINRKRKKNQDAKDEETKRSKAIADQKRMNQTLDSCKFCLDSRKFQKDCVVSIGLKTYLSVPSHESLVEGHCFITPMSHVSSTVQLDEDIHSEMMIWRKGLVAMFNKREEDCVFIETAKNVNQQPHMRIECIPIPREIGESAPIYFKKAIMDSETEWSDNKKVVDLSEKGLRRTIPKGFSYFAVDFGHQNGYAHVIENEHLYPAHFGKEIVGGMLDLAHNLWRKPQRESFEALSRKVSDMKKLWAPFDWTERVKNALEDS